MCSMHRRRLQAGGRYLRDALPHVGVPTLTLYGDQDVRAPLPVARDLHSAIPGSHLVVLRGAGHLCNIESPDAFNAAVRDFLDEKHGGTAPGSPLPPRAVPP
ncbi:MAG: alpha/beta hydrolase [Nocardioides sp.]